MKKYLEKVVVYMLIFSICLSSFAFVIAGDADDIFSEENVSASRVDYITGVADEADLLQPSSVIVINDSDNDGIIGNGNIKLEIDRGLVDYSDASVPEGKVITNARIVGKDGRVLGTFPSSMTYDAETEGFIIKLNEAEYFPKDGDESFEFSVQYTDAEGNVVTLSDFSVDPEYHSEKEGDFVDGFWGGVGRALKTGWGLLTDTVNTVVRMIEEIVNGLLIPLGDGILYMVFRCVGEVVTIDGLIFGEVNKVSIDYFNNSGATDSIKAIMSPVVNKFYGVFFKVAILVYMVLLVVTGIQVMLQSTAQKRAKYKEFMVSWLVGVAILCLFPFVMKYIIKLNDAFVKSIKSYMAGDITAMTEAERQERNEIIKNTNELEAFDSFGKDEFIAIMLGPTGYANAVTDGSINIAEIHDAMIQTRVLAQKLNRFALTAVYFILIGQTIVVLIQYYKRAFMIAFLITIFPLVAMTYALDKIGDKKAQSFGIWFKEFTVNVIVQMFHAVVYALIVGAGMKSYVESGGQNWLFLILCILFLFQGEKILRNIFNVKSSANTIGDLAATGVMAYGVVKQLGGLKPGGSSIAGKDDQKDANDASARQKERAAQRTMTSANTNPAADAGGDPTQRQTQGGSPNYGQYTNADDEPSGVDTSGYDGAAAKDTVLGAAMKRRLTRGAASGAINLAGRATGTIMGATYGMSKGDTGAGIAGNALVGAVAGKSIGEGLVRPVDAAANKLEQVHQGNKVAKQIESGQMDGALGLANMPPPDIDENKIIGEQGETVQEIYRQALAEMARVTARKGKSKGELAYWSYIDKHTKK